MTGIIEQLSARVQSLEEGFRTLQAHIQTLNAGGASVGTTLGTTGATGSGQAANPFAAANPATPTPDPAANPFAAANPFGAAAATPAVTAEQITQLIQPYIDNDQIKAAFGNAMKGLGIDALPNTPPEKYGPLYAAFQTVIEQARAAGLIGGAQAGAAGAVSPTSII